MLHPSRVPLLVLLLFAIPGGADFSRFSHENSPIRAQLRRSIVAPPFSTVYSYHPAPSYGAQAPLYLDNTNDFYRNVAAGASPNPYRPPNPAPRYPSPFYSPPAQRPETFYPQQRGYQSPPPVQDDRQVPGVAYYSPSRNSAKKPPVLLISNYAADNFRGGATIQEYQPTASAPLPPRDVFRHPQYPSAYEQYQSVQRPPPAEQAYSFPAPAYQSFQSPDTRPPPTFRNGADLTDYAPSKAPTPPPTSRTSTSASPPGRPELIYSPSHVPPEEANPSMVPPVVYSPPPQGQQLNPPSHVPPTYETPGREGLSRPQPAPPHTNVFNPVEFVPHKEYLELGYRQPPENYFESGYPAAPRQENPYTLPPGQPRYSPAETPYTSRPPYTEEVSPRPTPPRIVSETPGTIVYPSERTFPTAPTPRYPEVPSAPPSYPYEETTPFVTISPHPTSRPPPVGELTGPPSETVFTFSPPTGSSTTVTPRTEGFVPPFFSTSPTPPTRFPTPPFVPPETPRTPMFPERTPGIPTPMVPSTPRFPETSPMPEKTPPPAFPTRPPPSPTPSAETPRVPERPGSTPPFPPETPVFPTPMVPERTPGTPPIPERPTPMVPSTPEFPRTPTVPERTLSPSMPPFETPKTPQPPQTTSPFVPPETPRTPTIPERTPGFPTPMMSSTPRFPETPPMPEKTPPPEVPMHPPSFPTQPPPVQTSPTPKIPPITASRPPETPPVPVSSTAPPPTMVPNRVRGKAHVICEEEGIQFRVTTLFPFTGQIFAHDRKRVPSCVHTFSKATPVNITFPYNECGIRNAGNQSAQTQFHMQIIVVFEQPDGSSTIQSFISQCLHQKVQYQKQEIPKRIEEALEELHLIPTKLEQKAPIPECRMRIVKEMEHGHEGDGEEVGNSVDLGQPLRIEWSLVPESDAYGFHVRNCTVKDLVSSVEHTVIDERGCSTDLNIFAHPHYDTYHDVARVHWHAFKVPDNSQLSIRCSFQICSDIADSNNGLTSCDSIPSPPFCPDLITSPSNSILFDINGNLVEKRSAFHGAPGDLHQHVHASICFAAPDDGFCDSQQFELQRQNHLRAVIASERYCVSRVWLTIVSGTSLWTTLISVGVNFYCRFAHRRRALSSNPMLVEIPQVSDFFKSLKTIVLDDVVDRLNYYATTCLLVFCAMIVATKQHFGSPINCLISSEFPQQWIDFVHSYCFITGTYDVKESRFYDTLREHGYYQWIPFVLFGMALLCYVPHLVWRLLQSASNLDLQTVVSESMKARSMVGEERAQTIKKVVDYAKRYLNAPNFGMLGFHGRFGMYTSVSYVISKLLNCINAFAQISVINYFYGDDDYMWGYKLLTNGFSDPTLPTPFPRLTHCKFDVHDVGNTRPYETDCVIMVNILNEKIFLVIWLWLHFVAFVSAANLLYTVIVLFVPVVRRRVVENHLRMSYGKKCSPYYEVCTDNKQRSLLKEFACKAMCIDGVQLVRFINNRAGGLIAHEVIKGIWKDFVEERQR